MIVRNKSARIVLVRTPTGRIISMPPLSDTQYQEGEEIADMNVYLAGILKPLVDSGELVVKQTASEFEAEPFNYECPPPPTP